MRKQKPFFIVVGIVLLIITAVCLKNRHAKIDEWSSSLVIEKIDLAEASREYGIDTLNYTLSQEDYRELIPVLYTVKENRSSRKEISRHLEEGYRLAFFYEGKLWLFKCCENEVVSLMFEDAETGAYYGCEGKLLYIKSPELWHYIINTVNEKAE